MAGVIHEADNTYSSWSTWSYYWLHLSLTLALNTWILSKFSTFHWSYLLFILLISVGVELLLCIVLTLPQNDTTCFLESSLVQDHFVLFLSFGTNHFSWNRCSSVTILSNKSINRFQRWFAQKPHLPGKIFYLLSVTAILLNKKKTANSTNEHF